MPVASDENSGREAVARAAIKTTFDDDAGSSVALFVSHHLAEIEPDYWRQHLFTDTPEPHQILDLLELRSHGGGADHGSIFDFTLPGQITDYVISVRFDEAGQVAGIDMES